ncbi:hypothetical protein D8674_034550 [Pyrus ussuriensis x Pyrus communis]|uniref:Meiosis-specific protein ASY3-like coiled-coil domain-containing protein n=1 Tax=Pyrus ussuriensis x Pyrus communis TaxID=2448454 RepID=A0A5N5GNA6_9ROSA|nr:hypothetical protein D8674_034550 [Pyrus ussuriensis x Pyrus communis]
MYSRRVFSYIFHRSASLSLIHRRQKNWIVKVESWRSSIINAQQAVTAAVLLLLCSQTMEVDSLQYLRDDQTSNCRSFGSINHPSSQSRKISIGVVVDPSTKKKSGVTKVGEPVVPNAERRTSNLGNTTEEISKEQDVTAAKKIKQARDPEQVNSPWISTASFHEKMRTSDPPLHAKQSSDLPSCSGKQSKCDGTTNAPVTNSVQFFANQTSFFQSDGKKQKNFDGVSYRKRGVKDGSVELQDFTFVTAQEVVMMDKDSPVDKTDATDKEVTVDKTDATESRRTETLRMKLWEILGTVSSPDEHSKSQPPEVGDSINPQPEFDQMGSTVVKPKHIPEQKYDDKGDAFIKPQQNSDTIEMDSESPDNIVRRPVTRSLSRKRGPTKKQQTSTKNGPSFGYKLKQQENNIFSFEQECDGKPHGSSGGGSSKSMRKKTEVKSFRTESHGICLPEKDKSTKTQKEIIRSKPQSPAKQNTSVGKKIVDSHGSQHENKREYHELEKNIQEQEICQSPLKYKKFKADFVTPANNDYQKDNGNPSLKKATSPEADDLSPTFGIKTPTSSSSPSSIPNSGQMVDASSPAVTERRFTVGDIRSFSTFWTPKQDCCDNEKENSSDVVEELKDSPLRKTTRDMEENAAEDGLLSSSSEEGDLRSCGEGSPVVQGCDWTEEDNWIEEPSEPNLVDGLARAVELFTLELEKLKAKMKSATNRKSFEILMSVAAEVHMQLQTVDSQIQTDIGKLTNLSKSKRKRLESRFEEQQEQLKVIYDKFKEQVNQHLQECRSTLEGLEVYLTEFKGTVDKQKASHKKLLVQVEEAIEAQFNDAQRRIQVTQKMARGKMLQLKHELALCLKEGILS